MFNLISLQDTWHLSYQQAGFFKNLLAYPVTNKAISFLMNGRSFGNGYTALVFGLLYKEKKGHASAKRHMQVFELLKEIIPTDSDVTLLEDGEFDSVELLERVYPNTLWEIAMRTANSKLEASTFRFCEWFILVLKQSYRQKHLSPGNGLAKVLFEI